MSVTHLYLLIFCSICLTCRYHLFFFFTDTATTEIYTLSLHDALPIFVAPAFQRAAEELLVVAPAVHVGRVEEVDAFVERVVNEADRLFVIRVAVDARHRHEPEADGGDFERAASNLALFHNVVCP